MGKETQAGMLNALPGVIHLGIGRNEIEVSLTYSHISPLSIHKTCRHRVVIQEEDNKCLKRRENQYSREILRKETLLVTPNHQGNFTEVVVFNQNFIG